MSTVFSGSVVGGGLGSGVRSVAAAASRLSMRAQYDPRLRIERLHARLRKFLAFGGQCFGNAEGVRRQQLGHHGVDRWLKRRQRGTRQLEIASDLREAADSRIEPRVEICQATGGAGRIRGGDAIDFGRGQPVERVHRASARDQSAQAHQQRVEHREAACARRACSEVEYERRDIVGRSRQRRHPGAHVVSNLRGRAGQSHDEPLELARQLPELIARQQDQIDRLQMQVGGRVELRRCHAVLHRPLNR